MLEANLEAQLYGRNDDYFGSELKQAPLYRLQAFASYDFSAATYGALRLIQADVVAPCASTTVASMIQVLQWC